MTEFPHLKCHAIVLNSIWHGTKIGVLTTQLYLLGSSHPVRSVVFIVLIIIQNLLFVLAWVGPVWQELASLRATTGSIVCFGMSPAVLCHPLYRMYLAAFSCCISIGAFLCSTCTGVLYMKPSLELFMWHQHECYFMQHQHGCILCYLSTSAFYMALVEVLFAWNQHGTLLMWHYHKLFPWHQHIQNEDT